MALDNPQVPLVFPSDARLGRFRAESVPFALENIKDLRGLLDDARNQDFVDPLAVQQAMESVRRTAAESTRTRSASLGPGLTSQGASAERFNLGRAESAGLLSQESIRVRRRVDSFRRQQEVLGMLNTITRAGFEGAPLEALIQGRAAIAAAKLRADADVAVGTRLTYRDIFGGVSGVAESLAGGGAFG